MRSVGVRELRQNLSKHLVDVKAGEVLDVTEHGRVVARLVPAGPADNALARLAAERGATLPTTDLLAPDRRGGARNGPRSAEVLAALRDDER